MGSLSPIHWIVVLVIVLLLFGPSRLAGLGKGLGEGIRALKKGVSGDSEDDDKGGAKRLKESP
jgi:sec-independent protein translocase protein TatA